MNASTIIRTGLLALVSLFLLASVVFAGDFKNGGLLANKSGRTFTVSSGSFQNYTTNPGRVHNAGNLVVTSATKDFINGLAATYAGYVRNDTLTASGTITVGQDFLNSIGVVTNIGTVSVGRDLTSSGATFTTTSGTVDYTGNGAQGVFNTTYGTLQFTGTAGTKTLAGIVTASTSFVGAPGVTVAVGVNTLTLNGTVTVAGTLTSATTGTVVYGGAGQDVFPASYGNLTLSGSGTKTAASGTVSIAGTYSNSLTLQAVGFTTASSAVLTAAGGNTGTTKVTGTVTFGDGLATSLGGTFDYNASTGTQTVKSAQYTNLTISATGGTGVTLNSAYYISGNYTPSGSTARTYTGSTLRFNGSGVQSIAGDAASFAALEFYNAGVKTLTSSVTTTGAVTIDATVNTGDGVVVSDTFTLTVGGDLTNDGILTNNGTITVN